MKMTRGHERKWAGGGTEVSNRRLHKVSKEGVECQVRQNRKGSEK